MPKKKGKGKGNNQPVLQAGLDGKVEAAKERVETDSASLTSDRGLLDCTGGADGIKREEQEVESHQPRDSAREGGGERDMEVDQIIDVPSIQVHGSGGGSPSGHRVEEVESNPPTKLVKEQRDSGRVVIEVEQQSLCNAAEDAKDSASDEDAKDSAGEQKENGMVFIEVEQKPPCNTAEDAQDSARNAVIHGEEVLLPSAAWDAETEPRDQAGGESVDNDPLAPPPTPMEEQGMFYQDQGWSGRGAEGEHGAVVEMVPMGSEMDSRWQDTLKARERRPDPILIALGELPPDYDDIEHEDQHDYNLADKTVSEDDADADPSFLENGVDDEEGSDVNDGKEGAAGSSKYKNGDADEILSEAEAGDVAAVSFLDLNKDVPKSGDKDKDMNTNGLDQVLTASQKASVAELFSKKAPEKIIDPSRKLKINVLLRGNDEFPLFELVEDASWWGHRGTLEVDSRRPGIKAYIARTETRGPKSAMYTTYVVHVKTAFHLRGVSRRFSDFVVLDKKLRAKHPGAPELIRSSRFLGTLSPGFVQERRQQLQEYLDGILADHQCANSPVVRAFLALHGCTDIGMNAEEEDGNDVDQRVFAKQWNVRNINISELESQLKQCRSAKDAPIEARVLNRIGLVLCDRGDMHKGLDTLKRAVASARVCQDRRALLSCLCNLACAHCKFGGRKLAMEVLEEAVTVAQRLQDSLAEAECLRKVGLAQAADGDIPQALATSEEVLSLYVNAHDDFGEAATRFSIGVMKYEVGDTVDGVSDIEESLKIRRKMKDKVGIAESLNRLGLALIDIGYNLQALDYLERALALCQEVGDLQGQAHVLRLLAYLHFSQVDGDRKLSLELFKKSLTLCKRINDVLGQAMCNEGVGDVLAELEDYKLSGHHYKEAVSLREASSEGSAARHDPTGHQRHMNLLYGKIKRVQAKALEADMERAVHADPSMAVHQAQNGAAAGVAAEHDVNSAEDPDFLWRSHGFNAEASEEEGLPHSKGVTSTSHTEMQDEAKHSFLYYRDVAAEAVVSALARLWA